MRFKKTRHEQHFVLLLFGGFESGETVKCLAGAMKLHLILMIF